MSSWGAVSVIVNLPSQEQRHVGVDGWCLRACGEVSVPVLNHVVCLKNVVIVNLRGPRQTVQDFLGNELALDQSLVRRVVWIDVLQLRFLVVGLDFVNVPKGGGEEQAGREARAHG